MAEYPGFNTDLYWDRAGGTVFVKVGQIRDLSGPGLSRNAIDSSHRDTTGNWMTFIRGYKDPGEISFDVILDQDLATQGTAATGLLGDFSQDGTVNPNVRLIFPDGWKWTCKGFLTGYEPSSPLDDVYSADITLKLSGTPTFSST